MLWLINQVLTLWLSFSASLPFKCVSIKSLEKQKKLDLLVFDLNPVELSYYPFMINLDKCNGSCNAVDDLRTKLCLPSETKQVNVIKVFNIKIVIYEAETMIKHISCDFKCKINSTTCISNQNWNTDTQQCECKKY